MWLPILTVPFFNFFSIYIFRQPFLVVADPDMVKDILVKEFPKFHDRKVNLKKNCKSLCSSRTINQQFYTAIRLIKEGPHPNNKTRPYVSKSYPRPCLNSNDKWSGVRKSNFSYKPVGIVSNTTTEVFTILCHSYFFQCTIYQKRYSTISHQYNLRARLLWPQHEKSLTCIYMHNICHKTNTNRLILILTLWVSLIQFLKLWFQKLVNFRKPYDRMLQVASGQKWKDIRSTLSPTFSAAKMKQAS